MANYSLMMRYAYISEAPKYVSNQLSHVRLAHVRQDLQSLQDFYLLFIFMHMGDMPAYISVCHLCPWCSRRREEAYQIH